MDVVWFVTFKIDVYRLFQLHILSSAFHFLCKSVQDIPVSPCLTAFSTYMKSYSVIEKHIIIIKIRTIEIFTFHNIAGVWLQDLPGLQHMSI